MSASQQIVYTSCKDYIITLEKLPETITDEKREDIIDVLCARYKANKLRVIQIEHKFDNLKIDDITYVSDDENENDELSIKYFVGCTTEVLNFDADPENDSNFNGIYYYLLKICAFHCDLKWEIQKNMLCLKWYENGSKHIEGKYKNGEKDGVWKEYHCNGQQKSEKNFTNEKLNGISMEWYYNGCQRSKGMYIDGKAEGIYMSWFDNGQQEDEGKYMNGKQQGIWISWYRNGVKNWEETFAEGRNKGIRTFWYDDGTKSSEQTLKNGKFDGKVTKWHKNGQKASEAIFADGKLRGEWTLWNDRGEKYVEKYRTF